MLRSLTPHILLVARDEEPYRHAGIPVVRDRSAGAGPLGGLYTALLESPTQQIVVIACDMPFLTVPFLARLADLGATAEAAVPRDARGQHPLCASYDARLGARLRERIDAGALGVRAAIARLNVRDIGPDELAPFDPDGRLLMNVNTPEDYARAMAACEKSTTSQHHDPRE